MPSPVEVVRVITRLNIGGPARQALSLTRLLADRWPTRLVAGIPEPDEGELRDERVEVSRAPLVRPLRPVTDARAVRELRRLLAADRPTIVHSHMAKAGSVARVAALSMRARPRLVHTFHGHVLDAYFGRATERAFIEVERRLARRTDALVAVSSEIRDQLLELGIGAPAQYHVIPLGFDLSEHRAVEGRSGALRGALGLDDDAVLVGIVGRLVPVKDHDLLFRALRALPDVHLAVVGDGHLRPQLEQAAADLGIAERTHFTGWRLDVPEVMADLDLVALTSRNEGTPVSLIEAGACARAVVATDVGGVRSVVTHEATGLVVPPGDPTALAESIGTLLGDPERRARFGRAGREASQRFGLDRLTTSISELYESVAG